MKADHLLHAQLDRGWLQLSFECIGDPAEHFGLVEKVCDCDCEMCSGDNPDHWGCDRQEHDYSFDGRAPCETSVEATCWVHMQDCPIEETLVGNWPEKLTWPVPVHVSYDGDGEWTTRYAGDDS